MKVNRSPKTNGQPSKLGTPVPVRLDEEQERGLQALKARTGISKQAIIRLGLSYFIPRFISGEIDLQKCIQKFEAKKAA